MKVPCKYNPGDKIFAKVKGFVYWPARVNPLPLDIAIPPNKIPIFFYGTHEVFFISPTSCWPYDEKNKSKWGKPRPRAHFNQGMDEIENHSTIYQYGVDPTAEDFLSQFYEFKRSNGQSTTPNKLNKQENREVENGEEDESGIIKNKSIAKIAGVPKKRNKSGSSLSMKENKNNSVKSNAMTELSVEDVKSPESINDLLELSQPTAPQKKRQRSGSALSAKENTNCEIDTNIELAVEIPDNNVATRKRQISGSDDLNVTNIIKSNKSRGASRKRQRNDSVKEEKVELKMELNIDDKSKINMDCDNLSKEPIRGDKNYDVNQTVILELMPASIVKLENNLDDKLISEMLKKDANNDKQSEKSNESCHSEQFKDNSIPKTRCRSKSTSKKVSDKKESVIESDTESDSLSVDSDNPDDEDFRPARKAKKFTKKIKSPKQTKSYVKKSVGSQPKRNVKAKTQSKKKISSKVVSDGSLSSLSSVEEWNLPVYKEKKESEEKPKIIQFQSLQLNDSKEICNKTAESKSTDAFNTKNVEMSPKIVKEEPNEKIKDNTPVKEIAQDHENVEGIIENELTVKNYKSVEIIEEKEIEAKVVPVQEDKCVSEINDMVSENSTKKIQKDKEKKSMIIIDSGDEKDSSENVEAQEKNRKNKISLKEIKVNKIKSKTKPQLSRKRNRKLSSSSDSDVEIVKKESKPKSKKPKLVDRNSESDDSNTDKGICDKLQILQNFNADIRSSLMLGKEDYKTCLERFKSLCEMQIDLISLVKVWQLMDTVKKCRRYKRNEQIKQEAQLVYKRFMDIYTQASKDEIATAQSLLAQYRHQNNIQHQNVGVESSNKCNGLSIPISVADMFQNRLSDSHPNKSHNIGHNKDESVNSNVSTVNSVADNLESSKPRVAPTEEEINEEKMRLLSIDLEAKVSDILNKIEKNVEVMNQKSLSHLLPSTDENFTIKLPTQWKSMNEKSTDKEDKYDDNSDEDEEDVEAIVRRIEEVPIKLPEPEIVVAEKLNVNGSSSALDARIENLFNSSFITVNTKDARQKKTKNSSRHHSKPSVAKTSTSPSAKLDNQKLDHQESVVIKNSDVETDLVTANVLQEDQKDDIEIYDLLGV